MRFVVRVLVRPKAEVRDPQGEAVRGAVEARVVMVALDVR